MGELAHDTALPADWREIAASLLADFPPADFVQQFDATDLRALSRYADVLFRARMLFVRVQACAASSEQRRYAMKVLLRHFP